MANEILSSQRNALTYFDTTKDVFVDYTDARTKKMTTQGIVSKFIRVESGQNPRWGSTMDFEFGQSDSLGMIYAQTNIDVTSGANIPDHAGLRLLERVEFYWGANNLMSYDYKPTMQAIMSRLPTGQRELILRSMRGGSPNGPPGAETLSDIITPIPFIFDRALLRGANEFADLRNVSGRMRIRLTFSTAAKFYAGAPTTIPATFGQTALFYSSQVFSEDLRVGQAVPAQDLRRTLVFKSVDIQTLPAQDLLIGTQGETLIDVTSLAGPVRAYGVVVYDGTAAEVRDGIVAPTNTIYPDSISLRVNGNKYYEINNGTESARSLIKYQNYSTGNSMSDEAYVAGVSASSAITWLPLGVSQDDLRTFAGCLDTLSVNKVHLAIKNPNPTAVRAVAIVALIDTNYIISDRGFDKSS